MLFFTLHTSFVIPHWQLVFPGDQSVAYDGMTATTVVAFNGIL
jgi:hypothetical protein